MIRPSIIDHRPDNRKVWKRNGTSPMTGGFSQCRSILTPSNTTLLRLKKAGSHLHQAGKLRQNTRMSGCSCIIIKIITHSSHGTKTRVLWFLGGAEYRAHEDVAGTSRCRSCRRLGTRKGRIKLYKSLKMAASFCESCIIIIMLNLFWLVSTHIERVECVFQSMSEISQVQFVNMEIV